MPKTAALTRADMADRARNQSVQVAGGGHRVHVSLMYDGVLFKAEDLYDALAAQYGTPGALSTNLTGANNDLTFTAREAGSPAITIRYLDPAANSQALAITVAGRAITVSLATGGGGAITSTAATIRDAVNGDSAASNLVFAANKAANDGTGVVTAMTATALTGDDGKVTSDLDGGGRNAFRMRISA